MDNDTTFVFQLAVRDPSAPRGVPLDGYLRGRSDGTIDWEPYLGRVLLDLRVDGVEVWPYALTVGDLQGIMRAAKEND